MIATVWFAISNAECMLSHHQFLDTSSSETRERGGGCQFPCRGLPKASDMAGVVKDSMPLQSSRFVSGPGSSER